MAFDPSRPFNELPSLPPAGELERRRTPEVTRDAGF